ncbi:protein-L-isoaspartate O-methyltransferase [Xylariales sp. AK1849]|nr:protein-L-isoaspartate O-methyltransferase [Xylariales sp. AK1849]
MAWRSSGQSNVALVENMYKNSLITSPIVKAAFLKVDRAHYAPSSPYQDSPQAIGHGATISAPHMHANAVESLLEYILPASASEVLDIGSGSGYLTHVLAELVGEGGVVVGVEHIRELQELGQGNMSKSPEGQALLSSGRVRFGLGDGRKGWTEPKSGWDAIHVGAAAEELHEDLVNQLRSPGRMFIPVGAKDGWDQYIWTVDKDRKGKVSTQRGYGVRYVPLTDAPVSRRGDL